MKQRALVELDFVLDTRHGTLRRIDEQLADTLVNSNLYRNRMHDNFDLLTNGVIDRAQYKELYAARDTETLFNSRMTDFVYFLRKDIFQGLERVDRQVDIDSLEVDINFYPYDLTPDEADIIRASIEYYLPWPTKVGMVRYSPEYLNPIFLDNMYDLVAYYNHEDWLGPNSQPVIDKRIPLVTLITPRIAPSGNIPPVDREIKDPFLVREACLIKFIALHHVPTDWACYNPLILQKIQSLRC
jgi:hypothetical protein